MSDIYNRFGIVIVGDELLSGKRRDSHFDYMVKTIRQRGGQLAWAYLVGDDLDQQISTYQHTQTCGHPVFSFGGIGATPDDLTRRAAAEAFATPLSLHPEGLALLRSRFGSELTPARRELVNFPQGASLIPNPVNQIPGFSLKRHHFLPGFPNMSQPMVKWVFETQYPDTGQQPKSLELALLCTDTYESELIQPIERVMAGHKDIKIACLPASQRQGEIELSVRGQPGPAKDALVTLMQLLDEQRTRYRQLP